MDEEDVGYRCRYTLLNSDAAGMGGAAEGLLGETGKTQQCLDRRRLIFSCCFLAHVGATSKPPLLQLLLNPPPAPAPSSIHLESLGFHTGMVCTTYHETNITNKL